MSDQPDHSSISGRSSRRRVLLAGTLAPLVATLGAGAARGDTQTGHGRDHGRGGIPPVATTDADWQQVAAALDRRGTVMGGTVYRVPAARRDLRVRSYGVQVKAGLALGSYAAFARYVDGSTLVMGDLVVTEAELQQVTDALHGNGLEQTAVHKHLLAHQPPVWWTHFHGVGTDPAALARGVKAALDVTATPPPAPPSPPPPIELDTAGIDAALGASGSNDGGIYKFTFVRAETITDQHRVLPPALGVTTALSFQPVDGGRAAINGDFAMVADEVNEVIVALRTGGIAVVELHNHALTDSPRLFYAHFWAVDDGVRLARALRAAVNATNVHPPS